MVRDILILVDKDRAPVPGSGHVGYRGETAMDENNNNLVVTISQHLEVDWQYVELVEAWNVERIAQVRSAGRQAARRLGYKIMTYQTDPAAREDERVVVIVSVREAPSPEDKQRMHERALLLLDDLWSRNLPDSRASEGPAR